MTGAGGLDIVKSLAEDSWVWGDETASAAVPAKLALAVNDLYEQDYIRAWDAILNDVEFVSFTTVQQLVDALRILAGPTSPLRGLLRLVVDNTTLIEPKPQAAEPSTTFSAARKKITELGGLMKPTAEASASVAPGALVTAHFQPIQQLLVGEAGKTPLDDILRSIAAIEQHLGTLGPEVGAGDPMDLLSSSSLRGLLASLRQQSQTLPPAIRLWVDQIADRAEGTLVIRFDQRHRSEISTGGARTLPEPRGKSISVRTGQ